MGCLNLATSIRSTVYRLVDDVATQSNALLSLVTPEILLLSAVLIFCPTLKFIHWPLHKTPPITFCGLELSSRCHSSHFYDQSEEVEAYLLSSLLLHLYQPLLTLVSSTQHRSIPSPNQLLKSSSGPLQWLIRVQVFRWLRLQYRFSYV